MKPFKLPTIHKVGKWLHHCKVCGALTWCWLVDEELKGAVCPQCARPLAMADVFLNAAKAGVCRPEPGQFLEK